MIDKLIKTRPAEILLVEDNENDVELTRIGFKKSKLLLNLHHAKDGVECMEFLRRQGAYGGAPRPDLILLDLNLPRMDGQEVMAEIVADEALCNLPVIVLTTSTDNEEIVKMYKLGCNSYIVKPVDFEEFLRVVESLADYWFTVVVLPSAPGEIEAKAAASLSKPAEISSPTAAAAGAPLSDRTGNNLPPARIQDSVSQTRANRH